MRAAIDADQLVYSAGFATEGEPISHTFQLVKTKIEKILSACDAHDDYQIYIGGEGNFREDLAISKTYKGTRVGRKPSTYDDIRKYLVERWNAKVIDGYEADDAVSMEIWEDFCNAEGNPDQCHVVCVTPDKDLNNTPGWHYNPTKEKMFFVTEKQANRHFWYQMLAGDKVDNIPGLPYCTPSIIEEFGLTGAAKRGCGEGSAKKIMAKSEDPELDVMRCYASWAFANGMESYLHEYLDEQANLLWMGRETDVFGAPLSYKVSSSEVQQAIEIQKRLECHGDSPIPEPSSKSAATLPLVPEQMGDEGNGSNHSPTDGGEA